jgi:hypothetical protein
MNHELPSRQAEFSSCLTSGADSGVTGAGSLGCLASTGNPSLDHSHIGTSTLPSLPKSRIVADLTCYRKQYSNTEPWEK